MNKTIIGAMLAGAAFIALCAFLLNRGHRALLDAQRGREAAELALKHQIVASEEGRKELQASVQTLMSSNDELQSAVEEAKAAAPGARPVSYASLRTEPVLIKMPVAVLPAPEKPVERACALRDGDPVSFGVDQIELRTQAGSSLIAGTAALFNAGGLRLASGRFTSALSTTGELAAPSPPRWGVEALGLCTRDGCGAGVGALLPPWTVLGLRFEARAGVLLGPAPGALAGVGVRW